MSKSKKKKPISIPPEKPSLQISGSSRTVKIKIDGMQGGNLVAAGGNIAEGAENKVVIAGGDVSAPNEQVIILLDELNELIKDNLSQQSQVGDLQEIFAELKAQANMSVEQSNTTKIGRLLGNIGSYLNLATFAATQAEKASKLFNMIKRLMIG